MSSNTESTDPEAIERELTESELDKVRGGGGKSAPTTQTAHTGNSSDAPQVAQAHSQRQQAQGS